MSVKSRSTDSMGDESEQLDHVSGEEINKSADLPFEVLASPIENTDNSFYLSNYSPTPARNTVKAGSLLHTNNNLMVQTKNQKLMGRRP